MNVSRPMSNLLSVLILIFLLVACTAPASPTPAAAPTVAEPAAEATSAPVAEATTAPAPAEETVTLTYLVDNSEANSTTAQALADAYMAEHPNVVIIVETRPGGSDGDNIVKTRLATGEMTDIFFYNSGSLLQALNPSQTLVDLSGEPFLANIQESFIPTVSQGDAVFGVPTGTAMGGGVFYNKRIYEELGLTVPTTWEAFVANNEAVKAAGIAPVIASFGDDWTSQLFVLADYYNVAQELPDFAEQYTANQVKYATTPAALQSFGYLQQGFEADWWQEDYATTTFEQGLQLIAEGAGAHYPMLTFALPTIATNYPDAVNDIGFFALPGHDAAKNGLTIWMPPATYIPQTTEHLEEAKDFLAFIASPAGAEALTAVVPPSGPYMIKDTSLPDDVLPAVKDLAVYVDSGHTYPALEFLSPLKGPSLQQITVAVGSGQMDAATGAANYDLDVEQQALQLGLPGWE